MWRTGVEQDRLSAGIAGRAGRCVRDGVGLWLVVLAGALGLQQGRVRASRKARSTNWCIQSASVIHSLGLG